MNQIIKGWLPSGLIRSFFLGVAAIMMAVSPSQAAEYNFGNVQVFFDTTVSAGVSMRVAERNTMFLPEGNGGPKNDLGDVVSISLTGPIADANTFLAQAHPEGAKTARITFDTQKLPENFDGSINTDDGRLNFDQWDLTSGVIKMTNDVQASYENYTLFARVTSFYDAVLNQDSSYERSNIGDGAKVDAGRDVDLLDLYVSADYEVGGLPLNLRAGRQVINWGEGTFILNGINTIAPIDVNAFRRPGVEIKEGLLPIWALYGSIGLPYDISLEAFYQLQWEEYQLDRPGTPFAGADIARVGSMTGGNVGAGTFIGGGPNADGFWQRNCSTPDALSAALDAAFMDAERKDKVCVEAGGTNPYVDYDKGYLIGQNEKLRMAIQGRADILRKADIEASDSGQYGIAARWYSETLNSTEFGFYFMNYHSRLPILSERVDMDTSRMEFNSYVLAGRNAGAATRGAPLGSCNAAASGWVANKKAAFIKAYTDANKGATEKQINAHVKANFDEAAETAALPGGSPFGGVLVGLPTAPAGETPAQKAVREAANKKLHDKAKYLNSIDIKNGRDIFDAAEALLPARNPLFDYDGVVAGDATSYANGNLAAVALGGQAINEYSSLHAMILNCALTRMQANAGNIKNNDVGIEEKGDETFLLAGSVLSDGAEVIVPYAPKGAWSPVGLYLEYPEDIKLYGFSFNTTLGDWGVQGEVAFRQDQPLQLDTDQITIAALGNLCLLDGLLGPDIMSGQLEATQTYGSLGHCGSTPLVDGKGTTLLSGVKREDVMTAQIGTTATYTRSHPFVDALGADIGVLVTELGAMWVPDVPGQGEWGKQQLANVCTAGSDLPMGSFLALDKRTGCRPTSVSYGYVLLGMLQYNNAFGSAVTLTPSVTWSHDVSGNSPAPLSNYREGRKRVSLSLSGSYQNTWRAGISYTNFFGNEKYSKSGDKDFISANVSYSF